MEPFLRLQRDCIYGNFFLHFHSGNLIRISLSYGLCYIKNVTKN